MPDTISLTSQWSPGNCPHDREYPLRGLASVGLTEELHGSGTVPDNRHQRNPDSVQYILKKKYFLTESTQEWFCPFHVWDRVERMGDKNEILRKILTVQLLLKLKEHKLQETRTRVLLKEYMWGTVLLSQRCNRWSRWQVSHKLYGSYHPSREHPIKDLTHAVWCTGCQGSSLPANGQPHGHSTHTDIQIQCLEFAFKESILHVTYELNKKSNKCSYCHWKGGKIIWNLITKGENVALGHFVAPNAPVPCITSLANAESVSHEPHDKSCTGALRLWLSTTEEASDTPKCRKSCELSCLVNRHTARLNMRGLGL